MEPKLARERGVGVADVGGLWRVLAHRGCETGHPCTIIANHQVIIVDHKHKLRFIQDSVKGEAHHDHRLLVQSCAAELKNNLIAEEFATQSAQGPELSTPSNLFGEFLDNKRPETFRAVNH